MSAEDGKSDTLRPRLDIAGARSQGRWIRQFDQPIQRLINRFIRRQEGVSEVEVARIVHEIFQATRHEGWSLEGLHLAGPDLDHADLARISVGAFSGAGLDDVTLEFGELTEALDVLSECSTRIHALMHRLDDGLLTWAVEKHIQDALVEAATE